MALSGMCMSYQLRVLVDAAAKGDELVVERALSGEWGHLEVSDRNEALLAAVSNDNRRISCRLLESIPPADNDCEDCDGYTPLMLATCNGFTEIAKMLIQRGCDVDLENNKGMTALHLAVRNRRTTLMRMLIRKGCDINAQDQCYDTPLMVSALKGYEGCMKLLISKGCKLNMRNHQKLTALHFAAKYNQPECVTTLLDSGAEFDARNIWDQSPLFQGILAGSTEACKKLIQAGADIFLQDNLGRTLLHAAVTTKLKDLDVAMMMLEKGLNPNVPNVYKQTPLMDAVTDNKPNLTNVLLEWGADPNCVGKAKIQGKYIVCSALDVAVYSFGNSAMSQKLYNAGGQVLHTQEQFEPPKDLKSWLTTVLQNPRSLMSTCGNAIRQCVRNSNTLFKTGIQQLPLPNSIKQYLISP